MNSGTKALVVFAKVPVPGHVKTRLTPYLSGREAADLYRAFLLDSLDQYAKLDCDVRLYLADTVTDSREGQSFQLELETEAQASISVHKQRGEGLGERLHSASVETFSAGFEKVVLIGTDHPTLPPDYISRAFESLTLPESACIGPADDGGYYLIGTRSPERRLFDGLTFSHASVFEQALRRLRSLNRIVSILPTWYDVDSYDELTRLVRDLQTTPNEVTRTKAVVSSLVLQRADLQTIIRE